MSYLEEFLNSVNYLPGEVTRSLELIKLLDEKARSCNEESSSLSQDYFSSIRKDQGVYTENTESLQRIRSMNQNALNLSEEKVAISKQLLEMVEFHILKLKQDLDSYKREISKENESEDKTHKKMKIEKNLGLSLDMEFSMYMDEGNEGYEMHGDENKTYCYCNKVSYGEMIECEGSKCKRSWFHMECVGLTSLPNGSWFCNDCSDEKKKQASNKA